MRTPFVDVCVFTIAAVSCFVALLIMVRKHVREKHKHVHENYDTFMPCKIPDGAVSSQTVMNNHGNVDKNTGSDLLDVVGQMESRLNVCLAEQSMYDVDADQTAVTSKSSEMDGNNHFRFMDRQFASCDFNNTVINGLQWEVGSGSAQTHLLCQNVPRAGFTQTLHTDFRPENNGFSDHVLDCGDNALAGVGFESDRAGNVRARYDCAVDVQTDSATARDYYTGWKAYTKSVDGCDALDGHVVKCPDGHAMTMLGGRRCDVGQQQRTLVYKCAKIDADASAAMRDHFSSAHAGPRADAPPMYNSDLAAVTPLPDNVFDDLKRGLKPITKAIHGVATGLAVGDAKAVAMFKHARHTLQHLRQTEIKDMTNAGNTTGRAFSLMIKGVASVFGVVDGIFADVIDGGVNGAVSAVGEVGKFGGNIGKNLMDFIGDKIFLTLSAAVNGIVEFVDSILDGITTAVTGVGVSAATAIRGVFGGVADALDTVSCWVSSTFLWTPINFMLKPIREMKQVFEKIKKFLF